MQDPSVDGFDRRLIRNDFVIHGCMVLRGNGAVLDSGLKESDNKARKSCNGLYLCP